MVMVLTPRMNGNPQVSLSKEKRENSRKIIKELRDFYRLDHIEVSKKTGIPSGLIYKWMHYARHPSKQNYEVLLKYYQSIKLHPL